jgi:hypothetical protein
VSSRNWPDVEQRLGKAKQKVRLQLELDEDSISAAVHTHIFATRLASWRNRRIMTTRQEILLNKIWRIVSLPCFSGWHWSTRSWRTHRWMFVSHLPVPASGIQAIQCLETDFGTLVTVCLGAQGVKRHQAVKSLE